MVSKDVSNLDLKITDFGFSCFYDPKQSMTMALGSPLFMAPEVLAQESYTEKVDIWSIGVIAYNLLTGKYPFSGSSLSQLA